MMRNVDWISPPRDGGPRPRMLLLCDYRPCEAATVVDHVDAIRTASANDIYVMPIRGDIPDDVELEAYDAVILHYSVVMAFDSYLSPLARWRVRSYAGIKAAFIQDEYRFVDDTVELLGLLGVDVLFTCVPEDQVQLVYSSERLPRLRAVTVLTGYVPPDLLRRPTRDYESRAIDVGYRARRLPVWLGELAREKATIADRFRADADAYGLSVDISTDESARLYGEDWIEFIQSCRAMLGVESGASVFDFDGSVESSVTAYRAAHPAADDDEVYEQVVKPVDGHIRLNQISPRCFEAAALGTMMVLYDGEYSGILQAHRHYIPLRKDHSNMPEVVAALRDESTWTRVTKSARDEVAANPAYSFASMVNAVDTALGLGSSGSGPAPVAAQFRSIASRSYRQLNRSSPGGTAWSSLLKKAVWAALVAAGLLRPDPTAICKNTQRPNEKLRALRHRMRVLQSRAWWALRPATMPVRVLWRRGSTSLLAELGDLADLQRAGARAVRTTGQSPYRVIVDAAESAVVLRVVEEQQRQTSPPVSLSLTGIEVVTLDVGARWLASRHLSSRAGVLPALSSLLPREEELVGRLLMGPEPWAAFLTDGEVKQATEPR